MVSVPTSGKKIADEREIFKFLFQSIQLMPTVERDSKSASTLSVQVKLKYLNVDLVEGGFDNLTKKGKEKEANSNKKFGTAKQVSCYFDFCQIGFNFDFAGSLSELNVIKSKR